MPTFDIVNKVDIESFKNAVDLSIEKYKIDMILKESISKIFSEEDNYFILAESEMKLNQCQRTINKKFSKKKCRCKIY